MSEFKLNYQQKIVLTIYFTKLSPYQVFTCSIMWNTYNGQLVGVSFVTLQGISMTAVSRVSCLNSMYHSIFFVVTCSGLLGGIL